MWTRRDMLKTFAGVYANMPAPTNLTVPPYKYLSDTRIRIGEDAA